MSLPEPTEPSRRRKLVAVVVAVLVVVAFVVGQRDRKPGLEPPF